MKNERLGTAGEWEYAIKCICDLAQARAKLNAEIAKRRNPDKQATKKDFEK